MSRFDITTSERLVSRVVRHEPVRAQSVSADVLVPALIAGIVAGGVAAIGAATNAALGVFLLCFVAQIGVNRWLLYRQEEIVEYDASAPAATPSAETTVQVRREVGESRYPQDVIARFPVDAGKLGVLATGLLEGRTFSEGAWTGNGQLFTVPEFRNVREEMLRLGWLRWRKEGARQQGVDVTDAGRAELQKLLETLK
jgi:hypothetical protein